MPAVFYRRGAFFAVDAEGGRGAEPAGQPEAERKFRGPVGGNLQAVAVVLGPGGELRGIITDGDVRRMVENGKDINTLRAGDIMSRSPKTIDKAALAVDALRQMEDNKITSLVVLDCGEYAGLIHIHDIMREGIQ